MSWKLARKDMSLLIRNPITYLGIIFMIWIVVFTVSPFWNLYGNVRDEKSSVVYDSEGEIEAGYIPTTTEVVYQNVMQELRKSLISDCSLSEEVADKEIQKIQENEWSMDQIAQYFKDKYSLNGVKSIFALYEYMWATKGEMEEYLGNVFHDRTYTESFAYKYSEYLGIGSILFTVVIFALILARDLKKDIYALIHAKSLCGRTYPASVVQSHAEIHREKQYPPQRLYIRREKWRGIPGGDIPKRISVSMHQESDSRWGIYFQNP